MFDPKESDMPEAKYCRVDGSDTAEVAETTSTPTTVNDRINQMTAEEKADWLIGCCAVVYRRNVCGVRCCKDCLMEYLNSPYKEEKHD